MKGDFTRDTFDARKHFSRVLMQQGRVQLDADFNEQASILLHYIQTLATDLIGPYGGPLASQGFKIGDLTNSDFAIGTGRYYVNGILCENEPSYDVNGSRVPLTFLSQANYPLDGTAKSKWRRDLATGNWMIYLDVWEQPITAVQDGSIRESALGGPDTCTRARVVWQVKISKLDGADCDAATKIITPLNAGALPMLRAQVKPEDPITDACSLPPESRYRGLENQLYRIEIHRGNIQDDGTVDSRAKLTFKWSRDNGTTVYPIASEQGSTVYLHSMGNDAHSALRQDDWVEIVDDTTELSGQAGVLTQVDTIDLVDMKVTLKQPYMTSPAPPSWPSYTQNDPSHPLLRRWDQHVMDGITLDQGAVAFDPTNGAWIELESGIQVQFSKAAGNTLGMYRPGDYWLIPARVATGKIEWPVQLNADGSPAAGPIPLPQEARGIQHHYAPLATLVAGTMTSCRICFSVTEVLCPPEQQPIQPPVNHG